MTTPEDTTLFLTATALATSREQLQLRCGIDVASLHDYQQPPVSAL